MTTLFLMVGLPGAGRPPRRNSSRPGTALEALRVGTSVFLDFGFWARDERSALRWPAASAGATDAAELAGTDLPGPPPAWPGLA